MAHRAGPSRYLPADDTYLLRDALKPYSGESCLEIGFGSGAILAEVAGRFGLAVGTDILKLEDAKMAKAPGVELVLADRASCFRAKAFDLVFSNPPYLPSKRVEDRAVDGGRYGTEVPLAFLEQGLRVLKEKGRLLLLLSEEGDIDTFVSKCKGLGLSVKEVLRRRLFFESLVILRVERARRDEARFPLYSRARPSSRR